MEKITVECESITPMFMGGARGKENEIRPPSIKGVLRFWWRAQNGHLTLSELKQKESEIFGGTEPAIRSKVIILPIDSHRISKLKFSKTPRKAKKDKGFPQNAVMLSFTMTLLCPANLKDDIIHLIKVLFVLGGLGNRGRRGFGSFELTALNGQKPFKTMENYQDFIKSIDMRKELKIRDYPYIKEIQIGKAYNNYTELLKQIGQASHENNSNATGYAIGGRLASPIYVSTIKIGDKLYPIITDLNTPSNVDDLTKQEPFKNAIL